MELEVEQTTEAPVSDDPEVEFRELAEAALHNAGLNPEDRLRAAREAGANAAANDQEPAIVEAVNDELVYEIMFDLPVVGAPEQPLEDALSDTIIPPAFPEDAHFSNKDDDDTPAKNEAPAPRYPTRARRSAIGNQPYDQYAPRISFLQLGQARAHRSVLEASRLAWMTKEERMLATTCSKSTTPTTDDTVHRIDTALATTSEDELKVWGYVMTQYNLKPGLRKFGQRGQTAAVKELTQVHIMDTWTPLQAEKLSREQRMRALSSLLFLKEKRTGDIKGWACINGTPQRVYIPKEDAASPTVSTESTFITASIAAHEQRVVRCYDMPSAFVNTDVDKEVIMVLKGDLAEMMVQIAPEIYRKYIAVDKKGTKMLYIKLQKALYGLMRASLLFYRKLRKEFEAYGFEVNPYNPCVANKMTNAGKQLTVVWHVGNLMATCEDDFELTKFSCYLGRIYGSKLSMHTGRKHDYFGVDMEFTDEGTLEVSMFKYL